MQRLTTWGAINGLLAGLLYAVADEVVTTGPPILDRSWVDPRERKNVESSETGVMEALNPDLTARLASVPLAPRSRETRNQPAIEALRALGYIQ